MWKLNKGRIISLVIVFLYIIFMFLPEKPAEELAPIFLDLLAFLGYVAIGLALIWFGNEIGEFNSPDQSMQFLSFKTMPGGFYVFIGWVWLLVPFSVGIISAITEKK